MDEASKQRAQPRSFSGVEETVAAPIAPTQISSTPPRPVSGVEETVAAPMPTQISSAPPRAVSGVEETVAAPSHVDETLPPLELAASDDEEILSSPHPSRYTISGELGAGGIGVVHLAFDRQLGREVALKELRQAHGKAPLSQGQSRTSAEVRFLSEARITGRLEHPAIVPVYELGKHPDGTIYYTMKRVHGQTLTAAIADRDLPGRLALLPRIIDACYAVAYAHSRGVIHRDLKPDNILLGDFGETVVLDWGLAKARGVADEHQRSLADMIAELRQATSTHTVAGTPLGTPAYMPPEQAAGELDAIDERSDLYSLGAILYELLTGRRPFEGGSALDVIIKVRSLPVISPMSIEPRCPRELEAIVLRAMRKDPAQRYADAQTLVADLLAFQTGGLVGAHTYSLSTLLARWLRRHRRAIGVALVALAVGGGAWWYRGHAERRRAAVAEQRRESDVLRQVDEILRQTAEDPGQKRWFDASTFRLIALREPAVEQRLIAALGHPRPDVRRLVARALGGMGSRAAVLPLAARLAKGVETSKEVVVEVISALGIIGDWRAEDAVHRARWHQGQNSYVWKNTEIAYRMIPLPPLPPDARLTASEWHLRGRALENKKDDAAALAAYERAIALDPGSWRSLNNRANLRKDLGDFAGAMADYDAALKLRPTDFAMMHNRALLKRDLGDLRGALADADRAVALDGKATALRGRSTIRHAMGDLEGALADLRRALVLEPDSSNNHFFLADYWQDREDWPQALASYDRVLAINSSSLGGLLGRAFIHQVQGNLSAALADLDRALTIDGEYMSARRQRGNVRLLSGDLRGAREDFDRSIALRPDDAERWVHRAVLLHARRGDPRSLSDVEEALRRAKAPELGEMRLQALALATLQGDAALRTRRRGELERSATVGRWDGLVQRLIRGELTAKQVEVDAIGASRRCELHLATGLQAELRGDSAAAKIAYERGVRVKRPNWASCVLCELLASRRSY
jgi:tetratricopeptide (TPR) repeat protein/tRNA A-37 threonylcarbamoyl transferase component Bud32